MPLTFSITSDVNEVNDSVANPLSFNFCRDTNDCRTVDSLSLKCAFNIAKCNLVWRRAAEDIISKAFLGILKKNTIKIVYLFYNFKNTQCEIFVRK